MGVLDFRAVLESCSSPCNPLAAPGRTRWDPAPLEDSLTKTVTELVRAKDGVLCDHDDHDHPLVFRGRGGTKFEKYEAQVKAIS